MKHPLSHLIKDKPLLESLAKEYGTPLYLYDKKQLVKNINDMDKVLGKYFKKYRICYTIKANSNPNLVRILKSKIPDFNSGDTISVDVKVREGNKERIQRFEGVVIARHRKDGLNGTFTVRKVTNGVGVERIFPTQSPMIESINVKRRGKVRRSKLNYLKNVKGAKAARIEERR